jgi:hypothetical protein
VFNEHFNKLLIATAFAFLVPAIAYLVGLLWSGCVERFFGGPVETKSLKVWATICISLPIVLLAGIVHVGFEDLCNWWHESPLIASMVFLVVFIAVPLLLVRTIIALWRRSGDPSGRCS